MSVQQIDPTDFGGEFGLYSRNSESTRYFLADGVESCTLPGLLFPPGYRLIKAMHAEQYRVITTCEDQPQTVYAIKLIEHPPGAVQQVTAWRAPSLIHKTALDGFPQHFFAWLLARYSIIVSESEQTGTAQRFWLTMVDWAYHSGYVLRVAGGEPITTLSELENQWSRHTWDNSIDQHQQRRLVISKQAALLEENNAPKTD